MRSLVVATALLGCTTLPQPDLAALSRPAAAGAGGTLTPAPGVPDESGRVIDERAVAGKVVLLDFFATWCQPCQFSTPFYRRLHQRFASKGLAVVAISVDDSHRDLQDYLRLHPLPFPAVWDQDKAVSSRFGVAQLPTSFLFDRQGRLRKTRVGFDPEEQRAVEDEVRLLLGEHP